MNKMKQTVGLRKKKVYKMSKPNLGQRKRKQRKERREQGRIKMSR